MATSVPMGIVSLKAEGAYAANKLYKKGMWVTSSGSSYAYINPTPSTGASLTETSHWQQIAAQGPKGDAGGTWTKGEDIPLQSGGTVGGKLTEIANDFSEAVGAVTVDSEVVLARGGKTILGDRLDETESKLAQTRTSTRVVATKDSLNKLGADYVCDGTNDAEIIREALHDVVGIGEGGESFGWTHVKSTPVVPDLDFPLFWHDGTKFHAYGGYDNSTKIGHSTSVDGVNWVRDVNPVLQRGSAGSYDDSLVAVFHPWQESDGSWHALYRANGDKIAYATSPDGVNWTKHANNPVINDAIACDPAGLIKSNGVYYLYANTTGGDRRIDIYTSTNRITWTKVSKDEPEWRGGRYCSCPFKYNGKFYLITSKYYEGGRGSLLELWEDSTPLFKYGSREFKGVVVYGRGWKSVDTPSVLTTTIERDIFYNNEFWCYYAKNVFGYSEPDPAYLTKENTVQDAIDKAVLPNMNGEVLLSEGEVIIKGENTTRQSISLDYGVTLKGLNTVIKVENGYNQAKDRGVVSVDQDCLLSGVILDGNQVNANPVRMLHISNHGKAKDIEITNTKEVAVIYGEIDGVKYFRNAVDLDMIENAILKNGKVYGNQTPHGLRLRFASQAINCESFNNQYDGIYVVDDSKAVSCKSFNNGRHGISLLNDAKIEMCEIKNNVEIGVFLNGRASVVGCIIKENARGIENTASSSNNIIGGEVINNGYGIQGVGRIKVDGVYFKGNKGYLDRQQITILAKSRITNCIFENGDNIQQYQIYIHDGGDGSTIGGNSFEKGSVGYIGKTGFPTPVTYNNEELD